MTTNIKFSVTVPAYKAQFLAECIDSILAQTYKNFELIIVNDASPQDLDSIVSKYDDPRIRYYKNKAGFGAEHVVGNWNKCLEYATGDYIICMGDDDKLLPNCLEEYVKLIKKYPGLGVYHGWTMNIDEKGEVIDIFNPLPNFEDVYNFIHSRLCRRGQYIGDFLFNVNLLKKSGGFYDLPYGCGSDDISTFIAASFKGVAHTQVPVFQYRINAQSISSSSHNREKMEAIASAFSWIDNFLQNNPSEIYIESLVRMICIKRLPCFFMGFVKYLMMSDMISNGRIRSIPYWFHQRKRFHYSSMLIFRMFFKSIVQGN
jgi:glycosyltransferase involved in cell wall biosynthesis